MLRLPASSLFVGCAVAAMAAGRAVALETDQFTLPPGPLADIGPEVQAMVKNAIQRILDQTNELIVAHLDRADELPALSSERQWRLEQAQELLSERSIASQIHDALGSGFPRCAIEHMISDATFTAQPAIFKLTCEDSIFKSCTLARPLLLIGIDPTVNLFGVYQGTDKLGHFFGEGYEYLDAYLTEIRRNHGEKRALRAAVRIGVDEERGVFGYIPSGAYSNADLAANYAGLMFYLNLTRPVTVDGRACPPILLKDERGWRFNARTGEDILRPFVSEHFDEAMNPSDFDWTTRDSIRKAVGARADRWLAFHHSTAEAESQRLERLSTWHGADYGHSRLADLVTIANSCSPEARKSITAGAADAPRAGSAADPKLNGTMSRDLSR